MDAVDIRLATTREALGIATLSRDYIERGLGWKYTREAINARIHDRDNNVIVAMQGTVLTGFAIMEYSMVEAHLVLFAVQPEFRRRGIGTGLLRWLIRTAEVAGAERIVLELRMNNSVARSFYESLGFEMFQEMPFYYREQEHGIRMELLLRQARE